MPLLPQIGLASLLLLPAGAEMVNDATLLVDAQVEVAAAAVAVLEKVELPASARAERLLPLANELARLHAQRAQVNAAQLEEAEARAAADREVQQLALRLLRAIEFCAASDYADSAELAAAVHRLSLAIEGELAPEGQTPLQVQVQPAVVTEQNGAEPAR